METKEKLTIQEKREKLQNLSKKAGEIHEQLLHDCKTDAEIQAVNALRINDVIVKYFYKSPEHHTFNTFWGWKKEGYSVKKGENAFLIWGRPKDVQDKEKGKKTTTDEDNGRFFPVSFIFSNAQVKPLEDA